MPYIVFTFVLSTIIQYDNITKSDMKNLENYYSEYIINSVNILNNNYPKNMGEIVVHNFRVENIAYHDNNNIYETVEEIVSQEEAEIVSQEDAEAVSQEDAEVVSQEDAEEEIEIEVDVQVEQEVEQDVEEEENNQENNNQTNNEEIDFIQRQFRVWSDIDTQQ